MRRLSASCALVCALFLVLFEAHPVYAQWVYNGVVISAAADYQMNSEIVSDGGDGAIIVWEDWRGTAIDIYAQKIDSWGYVKWTANGAPVCTADGVQMLPEVCTDESGGAIVVFVDTYSGDYDLYAQRIDSYGITVWAAPVAVTTAADIQYQAQICPDGQGGAVIV
ncbi:MAG: hypothetical protein P8181_14120, partial [bacterium]